MRPREWLVATSVIGSELNLRAITLALDGAEYEPEQFPGIVYRIKDPKTATLIFRSGRIVCTGAKSVADVKKAIKNVVERLTEAGFDVNKNPEVVVQNIVATTDLKKVLNLNTIAISLGLENVEYLLLERPPGEESPAAASAEVPLVAHRSAGFAALEYSPAAPKAEK